MAGIIGRLYIRSCEIIIEENILKIIYEYKFTLKDQPVRPCGDIIAFRRLVSLVAYRA